MLEFIGFCVIAFVAIMFVIDIVSYVCDFIGFCKRYDYDDYKKTERRKK